MATNAYVQWALGPAYSVKLLGLTEMPKQGAAPAILYWGPPTFGLTSLADELSARPRMLNDHEHAGNRDAMRAASPTGMDFEVLLGPVFFTWLAQLMLPVMLLSLVSEKQNGCAHLHALLGAAACVLAYAGGSALSIHPSRLMLMTARSLGAGCCSCVPHLRRLRTMMKIHGLSDTAYHAVQYLWFLAMYLLHILLLIGVGSAADLGIFRHNQYSLQLVRFIQTLSCAVQAWIIERG